MPTILHTSGAAYPCSVIATRSVEGRGNHDGVIREAYRHVRPRSRARGGAEKACLRIEVLGCDVVEELPELLDLLVLLTRDQDRGFLENFLGGEDRDGHPHRQRHGVGRT